MSQVAAVRLVCRIVAVAFVVAAATVALVPLPLPATGTCGPGTSSESAVAAFVNPGSIGAGPRPSVASGGRPQWKAFVSACQSATDTRMLVAALVLLGALGVGLGLPMVVRRVADDEIADVALAPPAWYPDPSDAAMVRWWDGRAWGARDARLPDPPPR